MHAYTTSKDVLFGYARMCPPIANHASRGRSVSCVSVPGSSSNRASIKLGTAGLGKVVQVTTHLTNCPHRV
jgi:hypothetical protein